ncbi:uncharacterized protein LOC103712423 isoform X2 [Phoenix dactylifera]|uniref:Uncharacterized protein LOC103712423 isoform X2 n=1 Tax=Phoenix dactylifera TaxID=42345 RepID=A0A8B9A018_PHODC|nr:uncharacterized protein LOC103712423 isoform X2 [Phoenix dactylifera]
MGLNFIGARFEGATLHIVAAFIVGRFCGSSLKLHISPLDKCICKSSCQLFLQLVLLMPLTGMFIFMKFTKSRKSWHHKCKLQIERNESGNFHVLQGQSQQTQNDKIKWLEEDFFVELNMMQKFVTGGCWYLSYYHPQLHLRRFICQAHLLIVCGRWYTK